MKKVLIADDSLFMRKVLKDLLTPRYQIVEANSGPSALKQIEKERPDLVLLDIVMPEGEEAGVKALRTLRKSHPDLPVIIITAVGQNAVKQTCQNLGVTDYIVKPFEDQQIRTVVERCLG